MTFKQPKNTLQPDKNNHNRLTHVKYFVKLKDFGRSITSVECVYVCTVKVALDTGYGALVK